VPYEVITTGRVPIKTWANDVDVPTLEQATNLANLPFAHKWVALMPDAHAGYGMPLGGVLAAKDAVIPNAVGVDIGCGVLAVQLEGIIPKDVDRRALEEVRERIIRMVPTGFNHHKFDQSWSGLANPPDIDVIQRELASAKRQLGTLGGGNHFIEIQQGNDGHLWVMIHSGSRNLGFKVAKEYNAIAQKLCKMWHVGLPSKDLAFLPDGAKEYGEYLEAMQYCVRFARANRLQMMSAVAAAIYGAVKSVRIGLEIHVAHNYADIEHHYGANTMVHRKGAVRARSGEYAVVPGSMGSNSYIVKGLGNPESFMSCSHGAGRRMGRKAAREALNLEEEQNKLSGVVHGLATTEDLDEASGAYKDIDVVMNNQTDLVEIVTTLTPLMSIKGGADNPE
jgi:tRNA-splicing ligase RtcB (3'-phosphate/5'-hydroxy nucleic acid ligase)